MSTLILPRDPAGDRPGALQLAEDGDARQRGGARLAERTGDAAAEQELVVAGIAGKRSPTLVTDCAAWLTPEVDGMPALRHHAGGGGPSEPGANSWDDRSVPKHLESGGSVAATTLSARARDLSAPPRF